MHDSRDSENARCQLRHRHERLVDYDVGRPFPRDADEPFCREISGQGEDLGDDIGERSVVVPFPDGFQVDLRVGSAGEAKYAITGGEDINVGDLDRGEAGRHNQICGRAIAGEQDFMAGNPCGPSERNQRELVSVCRERHEEYPHVLRPSVVHPVWSVALDKCR